MEQVSYTAFGLQKGLLQVRHTAINFSVLATRGGYCSQIYLPVHLDIKLDTGLLETGFAELLAVEAAAELLEEGGPHIGGEERRGLVGVANVRAVVPADMLVTLESRGTSFLAVGNASVGSFGVLEGDTTRAAVDVDGVADDLKLVSKN